MDEPGVDEPGAMWSELCFTFGGEPAAAMPPAADEALDPVLATALEPVLRDLRATGGPVPRISNERWGEDFPAAAAMRWSTDGSGAGVSVDRRDAAAEQVVEAADGVQEWAVEELWRRGLPTNWPVCPAHPGTHPLRPELRERVAAWCCPASDAVVATVGALPPHG